MGGREIQRDIDQEIGKCSSSNQSLQYETISAIPSCQADRCFTLGVDFSGCRGALSPTTAFATVQASQKLFSRYQTPL